MRYKSALLKSHAVYTIAVIGFIYTIHIALPIYSHSSFLSLFVSEKIVGMIYMLSALATIMGFLVIPFFIRKAGNFVSALWLVLIQMGLFYGLATSTDPLTISILFIFQGAIVALIGFCLDVFLEVYSDTENVGFIRGMYMTTLNSGWVIAPLLGSMIIGPQNDYRSVYMAALFMLIPLFYLIYKNFPNFKDPHYRHQTFLHTLSKLLKDRDHSLLLIINSVLQIFYAWMIVYSPIYLHTVIKLDWSQIGIVLTVMLLPFPILQWPLGKLADKKYGEKEIMMIGFALLGLSTIGLGAITTRSVVVWAIALFISRIGAASAEVMIETYFFKTVNVKDSSMLGFFRITRSISYFVAPLITGLVLFFTTDQSYMFVALGIICLFAMIPVWKLTDTN